MAFIHKYSTIARGNTFNKGILESCINPKEDEGIHP